tara:strand:+ start:606 stop:1001 length:396 start_codon:yes stop_codon:yes gene_type:complete
MRTQRRVFEKLSETTKVELASERIELGVVNDLKKYNKAYDKYFNEGLGLEQKAERIKKELKELVSALYKWEELGESFADDVLLDLRKADEIAKELGIKPEQIKEYQIAQNDFKKFVSAAKRFKDTAKKYDN